MKHVLIAGFLGLVFASCSDSNSTETVDGTEQELNPGMEVAAEPIEMEDAATMEDATAYTTHFEAALTDFDGGQFATAADKMELGISALENQATTLEANAQQQLETVIEQLDTITEGVRAGEVTDRSEIEALVAQAQQVLGTVQQ